MEYLLADSDTILILVFRVNGDTSNWTDERFGDATPCFDSSAFSSVAISTGEAVGCSVKDLR
jgi:hypothetical protein